MKKLRLVINGFGRIGRLTLRSLLKMQEVEVLAINDLADAATLAHLFQFDSNYGPFVGTVSHSSDCLIINKKKIKVYNAPDPINLPWKKLEVDIVIEATGRFLDKSSASQHLQAGAKRVILSAPPASNDIPMIVLGVNDQILATAGPLLSNASCTTNCLAPLAYILDQQFGIESGYINTVHAYTADQRLQDAPHKDLRRARSAAKSIIPTTTGAAKSIGAILPQLAGKLDGLALRIPIATGSLLDFTVILKKNTTKEIINAAVQEAAATYMKGVIAYVEAPIVSIDVVGNLHACIFDAQLTYAHGNFVKTIAWYDNEIAYAQRIADLAMQWGPLNT